ncbi:helix-turn-helix domain-containing protein [Salmonella enterica]|nr:helix-turn-helix domain-containing protein [Salmonella enterica]
MNTTIETAIKITGSQKKLGNACHVSQQAVFKWLHNKSKVSPQHVNRIVNATKGQVSAYQIRPDLPDLFPHPSSSDPGIPSGDLSVYKNRPRRNKRRSSPDTSPTGETQ